MSSTIKVDQIQSDTGTVNLASNLAFSSAFSMSGPVTLNSPTIATPTINSPTIATPTMTGQAVIPSINLTSGQIVFPATQNPSTNANTLDDYEEGTWTAALSTSGTQPTVTFTQNQCNYIKIGRMVYVTFFMEVGSVSAQGTGTLRISGLPFTQVNNSSVENGAVFYQGQVFGYTDVNILTGRGIGETQILISTMNASGVAATRSTGTLSAGFIGGSYSYLSAS